MKLAEYLDVGELTSEVEAGFVSRKSHPSEPLTIFNYTAKCQYDARWTDVTRKTRGLIINESNEIVARPWPKFYNYGEYADDEWDPDELCLVTDKMDGSLGILYPTSNGYAIATRGSFTSEQAVRASEIWRERFSDALVIAGYTYLFEIIYPGNRVVVDYGEREDLVLLGCVHLESGVTQEPAAMGWIGPRVPHFGYMTLRDVLEMEPRPNAEGIVVTFVARKPETRVKIKQEDYVALHRIITGLTERSVWEHLAVEACAPWITDPNHWGSFVGLDPERASQILAAGLDWRVSIPEEFQPWIDETAKRIEAVVEGHIVEAGCLAAKAMTVMTSREQYEIVRHHPCVAEIMRCLKGVDSPEAIVVKAWRVSKPEATNPIFGRGEDVA